MYGHPRAYWADPEEERDKRVLAFVAGVALGAALGVVTFVVWLL